MVKLKVNVDGSEEYKSIQEAIDKAMDGDIIEIAEGTYFEKLYIEKNNIIITSKTTEKPKIVNSDYGRKPHPDGVDYGTFRTYTVFVGGNNIILANLIISNESGDGRDVGQAVALYADGENLSIENCRLLGRQDTLFCGPLPKSPRIPKSFIGPREHALYRTSRQHYVNCYIEGDIDFIFGSALATFESCEIHSLNRNEDINGYVTAPSTWEHEAYGFMFIDCEFTCEKGTKNGSVFLGRPWRPHGQSCFLRCSFGPHIHKDHFDPWGNEENKKTAKFSEYDCKYHDNVIPSHLNNKPFCVIL